MSEDLGGTLGGGSASSRDQRRGPVAVEGKQSAENREPAQGRGCGKVRAALSQFLLPCPDSPGNALS